MFDRSNFGKAQLSRFYASGMPGTAITITAISKAVAAVVTAVNTQAVGDVVFFGAVTSGSSFTAAIDSSGFATVGSTGTASPQNFSQVGNVQECAPSDYQVVSVRARSAAGSWSKRDQ